MSHTRYIPHDSNDPHNIKELGAKYAEALRTGLARIQRHPSSRPSVYIGAGGHLLLNWKLSDTVPVPGVQFNEPCVDIAAFPLTPTSSGSKASFLETSVGTAALVLAKYLREPSEATAVQCIPATKLIAHTIKISVLEQPQDDGCEVLYGRAGLLYALLFLQSALRKTKVEPADSVLAATGQLTSTENIKKLVNDIVMRGKLGANDYAHSLGSNYQKLMPSLMWTWHGKRYLGGAHGVAGILQMLLCTSTEIVAPHWDDIVKTIEWLLSVQYPSGNWPHVASKHSKPEEDDKLVQWCHGAPAILILLGTLLRRHDSSQGPLILSQPFIERSRNSLARGGKLVYARGILTKGVGLCHGVAGTVYALLAVAHVLDETPFGIWFARAAHIADIACDYQRLTAAGQMRTPDRPYSLYEGVAGMCCVWTDMLYSLERGKPLDTGMPGYDDLNAIVEYA